MAPKLVNTVPGEFVSPFIPGRAILAGLRGTSTGVDPTKTAIDVASTALINNGVLPDADPKLTAIGASVALDSPEKERPVSGAIVGSLSGGSLILTKSGAGVRDSCIYAVTVPINPGASVLGHLKFRLNTAWTSISPDWCNLLNLKGLYFGLEHGPLNTAAYMFLRDDGTANGTLVVGGPQGSPNTIRPGQLEISALDPSQLSSGWKTLTNNSVLEFFILFNQYTTPYTVEIWVRRDLDNQLMILKSFPVSSLGNFVATGPSASTNNTRSGPTNQATLFFGFSGAAAEALQVDDWALYPDYRKSVAAGATLTNSVFNLLPNGPTLYSAGDNLKLDKRDPDRWLPLSDGTTPSSDLFYQSGQPSKALYSRIYGAGTRTGYQRKEPRLETLQDGAMFEGVLSGVSTGLVTSMGIGIEDGAKSYRMVMIEDTTRRTIGIIQNDAAPTQMSSFAALNDKFDWTKPQLVRLTVDRRRRQILLYASPQDGSKLTSKTLSQNLVPNSSFEIDANADGWADNWGAYIAVQNPSLTSVAGDVYDGLKTQLFESDGSSSTTRMFLVANRPFIKAGTTVTVQARIKSFAGNRIYVGYKGLAAAQAPSVETDPGASVSFVATGAFQLVTYTFVTAADAFYSPVYGLTNTPVQGTQVWVDASQMEIGAVATDYQLLQSELSAPLTADETTPALIIPINQTFPNAPSAVGRMITGFLTSAGITSQLNVSSLLYLARYLAWEGRDGKLPDDASLDAGIRFNYLFNDVEQNLLLSSSFEVDSNSDGLSDGWSQYNNSGTLEPGVMSRVPGRTGGFAQRISWTVPNTSTKGITTSAALNGWVGWKPGKTYILSYYAKGSGTVTGAGMATSAWNNAPTVTTIANPNLTTDWQRYIFKFVWGGKIETNPIGGLWITIPVAGQVGSLDLDDVKLELGPSVTDYVSTGGGGSMSMSASELVAVKASTNAGTFRYYSQNFDFSPNKGAVIDFKTLLTAYGNSSGLASAANTDTGAGIHIYTGTYLVQVRFFDCGVSGKKIAIVPGNGNASDVVNQTVLGIPYSASVDWTKLQSYRLVVRPFDSIKLYIGSVLSEPAIVIPWANGGFNLPFDASTPSLQFGHVAVGQSTSTSKWDYMRWGASDGYDVSVKQNYPDGLKPYLFGGKFFSSHNFYEA